jgi:hypothetical protein
VISSATGSHDDLGVNRLERQDFDVAPGLFAYESRRQTIYGRLLRPAQIANCSSSLSTTVLTAVLNVCRHAVPLVSAVQPFVALCGPPRRSPDPLISEMASVYAVARAPPLPTDQLNAAAKTTLPLSLRCQIHR